MVEAPRMFRSNAKITFGLPMETATAAAEFHGELQPILTELKMDGRGSKCHCDCFSMSSQERFRHWPKLCGNPFAVLRENPRLLFVQPRESKTPSASPQPPRQSR